MPIARVQMPDGRIARFEVPEDMSPQDIEALAQTNLDELQQGSAPVQPEKIQQEEPAPPKKSIFEWAGDKIGEQVDSLSNFPKNPERIANRGFEEARPDINDALSTALMMGVPSGMLNSAAKRIAFGAAGGAAHEEGLNDKIKGGLAGASLGIAAESIPAIQGVMQATKRRIYDPKFNPDRIIGATLKRFAEDPNNPALINRTINALDNPQHFIRGSNPTTAQAGANGGLWALDKALMNREQAAYRDLADMQNIARIKALKEIGMSEGVKNQGREIQSQAVDLLKQAKSAGGVVDLRPVESKIDDILGTGAGKQTQVQAALGKLKGLLRNSSGNLESDLEQIQGIRAEINTMLSGKLAGDAGNVRFASGQVGQVKGAIDDAIEAALANSGNSGLHRAFVDKYRQGANIINRADNLNTLLQRSSTTGSIPEIGMISAGQFGPLGTRIPGEILSPAKLNNTLKSKFWKDAQRNLTPKQLERVSAVQKDAVRSIPLDIKRGSDTAQNLTTDYIMQGIANEGLIKGVIASAERGINRTPIGGLIGSLVPSANVLENPDLRAGLLHAMQDPKQAAKLMRQYKEFGLLGLGATPSRLAGQFGND
jgi:hypothetical protein